MHVRVTYVQIHPDKVDEATRLYQDSVVPAAQQQTGFKSMTLVADRATGKCSHGPTGSRPRQFRPV